MLVVLSISTYSGSRKAVRVGKIITIEKNMKTTKTLLFFAFVLLHSLLAQSQSVTISTTATSVCTGNSVTITANPLPTTSITTYKWSSNAGGLTTKSVTLTPTATATYTVTATIGGIAKPAFIVITVNAKPTVSAGSAVAICKGKSTILTAVGSTGSTYKWNIGTTNPQTVSPSATTTYIVTGTNASGCFATSSVIVTVNAIPTVTFVPSVSDICLGTSTTITASGAISYSWSNGFNSTSQTVSPTVTTVYTVTGTTNSCSASAFKTINVNASPTVSLVATPTTIVAGALSTLTASGASTYAWSSGTGTTQTVSPSVSTLYSVTGTTAGCTGIASTTVTVGGLWSRTGTTLTPTMAGDVVQATDYLGVDGLSVASKWTKNADNTIYNNSKVIVGGTSIMENYALSVWGGGGPYGGLGGGNGIYTKAFAGNSIYAYTSVGNAVYGKAEGFSGGNGYSGYFEGGNFLISRIGQTTTPDFIVNNDGNISIGTSTVYINPLDANDKYKLSVNGKIACTELKVVTGWADFVFNNDYKLRSLSDVEKFIKTNKHLPEVPSAKEVETNGVSVGEMQAKMMQKIEELTLYIIEQQKQIEALNAKIKN